jgi:6-phosphogluconolactonase
MSKMSHFVFSVVLAMSAVLPVHSNAETTNDAAGAIFVMTNAADKNEIIAYKRSADGSLEQGRRFRTDGRGSYGSAIGRETQILARSPSANTYRGPFWLR